MCSGAGSETPLSKESRQVEITSSMTSMDVNDISSQLETTVDVPDSCRKPDRKGGDTAKGIIIPTENAKYIMAMRIAHLSAQDQCRIWQLDTDGYTA